MVRSHWAFAAALCVACSDEPDEPACAICTDTCEEAVELSPADHVVGDIDYPDVPPAGGPHNGCWAAWGFHETAIRAENWVHNLEHGGVVFLHHCPDGCDEDIGRLRALSEARSRTLVTEYAEMDGRFAAVAWGHRLVTACLDVEAFADFYDNHFDEAPESVGAGPPEGC